MFLVAPTVPPRLSRTNDDQIIFPLNIYFNSLSKIKATGHTSPALPSGGRQECASSSSLPSAIPCGLLPCANAKCYHDANVRISHHLQCLQRLFHLLEVGLCKTNVCSAGFLYSCALSDPVAKGEGSSIPFWDWIPMESRKEGCMCSKAEKMAHAVTEAGYNHNTSSRHSALDTA